MNFSIQCTADQLAKAEVQVERGEQEDPKAKPKPSQVKAGREAGALLAAKLDGRKKDLLVTVRGHQSKEHNHLTVTVSG